MKLLLSVLALETASKEMGLRYCGQMKGQSGHLQDEISLSENESCLYHIEPDQPPSDGDYHIELSESVLPPCAVSEMYIHQDGQIFGPYCDDQPVVLRHRRTGWINKWNGPSSLPSKPFDVIYTGHGLKFSFDFEFDMAPGAPRTKSLTFANQDKPYSGSAFSMKEQILNQIKGAKPIIVQPVPTRHPYRTFNPTYRPHFKPTYKPVQSSAYNNKEQIISSISPAKLPKPQKPTGGFASALDTKETILQTLNVQGNTAFKEKEQIYAMAESLGVNYSITDATEASTQATSGQIDLGLIDQIVDQSQPESNSGFVYQGYNVDSYLNSQQNTANEKDSLMLDLVETTTMFNEDVTYRLDTSTINRPRYTTPAPAPSRTVASPLKPSIKPLPDRELDLVFNRPRPNLPAEPLISAAQPLTKPVPEKRPLQSDTIMSNNINYGMERPNPIIRMDVHPVPHLPNGPLETMLVIATTTPEPPQVTHSTLAKILRGKVSFRQQLAKVLFDSDDTFTMEQYIDGVDLLKLDNMANETVFKLSDQRKKGLVRRIQRRLEQVVISAERTDRQKARNAERLKKKATRKSG